MGRGATGAIAALGDLGTSRVPAPGKFTAADGPFRRRAALISTAYTYVFTYLRGLEEKKVSEGKPVTSTWCFYCPHMSGVRVER